MTRWHRQKGAIDVRPQLLVLSPPRLLSLRESSLIHSSYYPECLLAVFLIHLLYVVCGVSLLCHSLSPLRAPWLRVYALDTLETVLSLAT